MITIAETPQYRIEVLKEKNRAYLTIIGFWRNPEQVSEYVNDWKKAVAELKPGFTVFTDATEMKIHPVPVREVHEKAQKLLKEHGILKVAELQKNKIAEIQLDSVSQDTKFPKKNFEVREEAEQWLDQ